LSGAARLRRIARAATLAIALGFSLVAAAPAMADSWGPVFRYSGPWSTDLLPAQLAFAPNGAAGLGFSAQDEDHPATSQGRIVSRSRQGGVAKSRRVPGAQEILDLAFDGQTLQLLTGSSSSGRACCSAAQVVSASTRRFGRAQSISRTLAGATIGRLLVLPGHKIVAAIATARGVWVSQSGRGGRLPTASRLTPAAALPQTLVATALPRGRSLLAWTATGGQAGAANPRSIDVAEGSSTKAPAAPHVALTVPRGHQIDELVAAGSTLAWIESWFDSKGAFRSEAVVGDLRGLTLHPRAFGIPGGQAAALAFDGNSRGDQLMAWKTCDQLGICTLQAVSRPAGGSFGSPKPLGPVDASQAPAAAMGRGGEGLVGWISGGHVYAADRPRAGSGFAAAQMVSNTDYAADLSLAFAPSGGALAAWTQGTLNTSVMGAVHHG
jgi:hypothetical protein